MRLSLIDASLEDFLFRRADEVLQISCLTLVEFDPPQDLVLLYRQLLVDESRRHVIVRVSLVDLRLQVDSELLDSLLELLPLVFVQLVGQCFPRGPRDRLGS